MSCDGVEWLPNQLLHIFGIVDHPQKWDTVNLSRCSTFFQGPCCCGLQPMLEEPRWCQALDDSEFQAWNSMTICITGCFGACKFVKKSRPCRAHCHRLASISRMMSSLWQGMWQGIHSCRVASHYERFTVLAEWMTWPARQTLCEQWSGASRRGWLGGRAIWAGAS